MENDPHPSKEEVIDALNEFGSKHPKAFEALASFVVSGMGYEAKASELAEKASKATQNIQSKVGAIATRAAHTWTEKFQQASAGKTTAKQELTAILTQAINNFGEKHPKAAEKLSNMLLGTLAYKDNGR